MRTESNLLRSTVAPTCENVIWRQWESKELYSKYEDATSFIEVQAPETNFRRFLAKHGLEESNVDDGGKTVSRMITNSLR